ncbi:MAG: hypothetical protein DRG80_04550 [Deltaproteobacteria bacterium]|nr:MAG: hypothetical protein DRG80_04550 [Deltaproteobacteria bacterium]RLB79728.1 MAG: hypothetical protein DRH24_12000 [Deltaproteobacteria bacterium]
MAIIKLGTLVTGVRGTIGGITYSANGAGNYAKTWAKPPNPKTGNQSVQRGYLAEQIQRWRDLPQTTKDLWATFAADPAQALTNSLGETYYASGYQWFTKLNIRLRRAGRTLLTNPPTGARPTANTTITLIFGNNTAKIQFTANSFNGNDAILFARAIPSSGRTIVYPYHRETRIVTSVPPSSTEISFKIQLAYQWGTWSEGWLCSCHTYTQTDEALRSAPTTTTEPYDPTV